ncbi:hypothetical protein ACQYAD_04505 [Neobacillus sp. SM06]|uniref:hypothetical protein n=1 Tax=Neobacillus sp. SM06 TaxID=3422492 RepID=UPI003D2B9E31
MLKLQLETILPEAKKKEDFSRKFIESFHSELTKTIDQHEKDNSQHHVMGNLVTKIKDRFDKV